MFFHFGAQAVVFAAQGQQTAEEGKHTEHDADNKCTEKHDNQRQIDVLAGQVEEGYGVGIGDGQQEENKKNQDFDDGRDEFHGLLRVGCGWCRPSEKWYQFKRFAGFRIGWHVSDGMGRVSLMLTGTCQTHIERRIVQSLIN